MKRVVGTIGNRAGAPEIKLTVHTPAKASKPVPIILLVNFGGGPPPPPPAPGAAPRPAFPQDPPVAADILARGWGYAAVGYQDIQPDRLNTFDQGVIGLTLKPGETAPAPDEWGTISAWSWGISRVLDYLETDTAVDARQVAVFGHSRLGKTVLWASALDERIAAVFSSCAGEMGSALARRDWGETVDDMAQNFPWQFAGNFQKWPGRWNEMPVDAHMLIALSAPRPVFVTGGTTDQWADPVGEFLAQVAAGPVYRLLGRKDLGTTELPPLDTPLVQRRSRLALSHGRTHGDARGLAGVLEVPGEVFPGLGCQAKVPGCRVARYRVRGRGKGQGRGCKGEGARVRVRGWPLSRRSVIAVSSTRSRRTFDKTGKTHVVVDGVDRAGSVFVVARFEELVAWQRCVELCDLIFEITRDVSDHHFQDQIRSAAQAAPALIAEGFARFTDAEFIRYLRMARGELAEIQSNLEIGRRQKYFVERDYNAARILARRAMGTTTNLLKSRLRKPIGR